MKNAINKQFQVDLFWQLLRLKCISLRKTFSDKIINLTVWVSCSLFVAGYLLQAFGIAKDFGAFQLGSILASVGLFELYGNAVTIVSDIEGDRTISYYLTLPASALSVLASIVVYYALIAASLTFILLPLAKIMLGAQLSLSAISWVPLILFIFLVNAVCAAATLLLSALIPSMDKFDVLWTRFIFPLWFLGGFQFSWLSVHERMPWFSYLMLANPITYTTEGVRAALLGQEGFLPLWLCSTVLTALLICISWLAYRTLKKRLDFV